MNPSIVSMVQPQQAQPQQIQQQTPPQRNSQNHFKPMVRILFFFYYYYFYYYCYSTFPSCAQILLCLFF